MPEAANPKLYVGEVEPPTRVTPGQPAYAELDVTTNYSFLQGASHPDEMVCQAACLGYRAMAVTDVNTLSGVVRAYESARKIEGFKLIVGARLRFSDGSPDLLAWAIDRAGYGRLCRLLTLGRRRAPKGECELALGDFLDHEAGLCAAVVVSGLRQRGPVDRLREAMGDRLSLALSLAYGGDDRGRRRDACRLARATGVALLATNHVHYHDPGRRALQDVLTCIRLGCTLPEAGGRLFANAERHLKAPATMHQLFAGQPQAIERGLEIARRCTFDLGELRYEYPTEAVPPGKSPGDYLSELAYAGARERYPDQVPEKVTRLLEKELKFICGSQYESYFLTVYDLVRFARSRGILCQGRGSAANSAVCYCLGVTSVDPARFQLVFERFASEARDEPPDIDVDFEHERREEVIQYLYEKYGRERAAMTASLITYRGRSAVRDVGKALGFSGDSIDQLADKIDWWHRGGLTGAQLAEAGIDPDAPAVRCLLALVRELLGFPRHLSQHVGGMVISRVPLCELVPIENASMQDRTVIEWDKDDLDALKLFKVDILALGMLTAISKGLALVGSYDRALELHTIPSEDRAVYEMICRADTVGVFQIESRAQMAMLPRLRPERFYDLVIEVAIVRPGPIQGDMVHPYLQRREAQRRDPAYQVDYPKPELRGVLEQTLGVPLFQEQAMRLAIVAAGFTGAEADQLRRAMAAWKRGHGLGRFQDKFISGMLANGYELEFAERCFNQIAGFGEYGFPESHAASFARLVYASAWLKCHHPAAFAAALLNSQPMGFYAPAQLVRDARAHGVETRPIDVNASDWDCTLELELTCEGRAMNGAATVRERVVSLDSAVELDRAPIRAATARERTGEAPYVNDDPGRRTSPTPALRLGFRQIKGLRQADAERIVAARREGGAFRTVADLQCRARLDVAVLERLARADAMASMGLDRRGAEWESLGLSNQPMPLLERESAQVEPAPVTLPFMPPLEQVLTDYATAGLSLRRHPVSFARSELTRQRVVRAAELADAQRFPQGRRVRVAGLVLVRQRPGTASGVVFITLEDETGVANLILWSTVYERYRLPARHATLLEADGVIQRQDQVVHVLVKRLRDRSPLLGDLAQRSRDFH